MSHVDLGFAEECDSWLLESYQFPSKIGGKPAWLDLENLPSTETLQCETCTQPMVFLCQIYAPYEEDDDNFHRTLFIFICRTSSCCKRNNSSNFKVLRNSLPRRNKFYSFDPPEDNERNDGFISDKWAKLCHLCGCLSTKQCSKCKNLFYCTRQHQIVDWKEGHKNECNAETTPRKSKLLFPEFEVVIEAEECPKKSVNEEEELEKFHRMALEGQTGALNEISDSEMEQHAAVDADRAFSRFKKRTEVSPAQVLRYERGGLPLWIAESPKLSAVPHCEFCGGDRQFEFQIMPQLLSFLEEPDLDWGVVIVYTCRKSCAQNGYITEFVYKQDVAIND